jgi:hypothetical protein
MYQCCPAFLPTRQVFRIIPSLLVILAVLAESDRLMGQESSDKKAVQDGVAARLATSPGTVPIDEVIRRKQLRLLRPIEQKELEKAEAEYLAAKSDYKAAPALKSVLRLYDDATNLKESRSLVEANRVFGRAADRAKELKKAYPETQAAVIAQAIIDGRPIPFRETAKDPDSRDSISRTRLTDLMRAIDLASISQWGGGLEQIPATVVDKGILKYVPYQSFKAGSFEFNVYGDPDYPAGIELGIDSKLFKDNAAKMQCLNFVASLLPDAGDRCLLKSLKLTEDLKTRAGLTLEITPETAVDAYGSWWVSAYVTASLEKSRATPKEIAEITVPREQTSRQTDLLTNSSSPTTNSSVSSAPSGSKSADWVSRDIAKSRPGKSVYVHDYVRKNGTYVHAHTRSAPGSGGGKGRK